MSQITIPEGWKNQNPDEGNVIYGPDGQMTHNNSSRLVTSGEPPRGLEMDEQIISKRWKGGVYEIVLEKLELMKDWDHEAEYIKAALLEWMVENEETTMMEEGEDIQDGLESMLTEDGTGVTDEVLIDATEIITTIIVARGMETQRIAPIFQKAGFKASERVNRIGRAEGMMKMREEMRKLKNKRMKPQMRSMKENDFEELEVREVRRGDASRRMETGVLRSDNLNNNLVQDKGNLQDPYLQLWGLFLSPGQGRPDRPALHLFCGQADQDVVG